ncbi:THO complex subunit 1 transcription elongation factor [Gracilaria domingensis]|nr:THO complex subunit 1 transcription elongation factor [Gracilaria domingensis]
MAMSTANEPDSKPNPVEEYLQAKDALNKLLCEKLKAPPDVLTEELIEKFPRFNFYPTLLLLLTKQLKSPSPFDALHVVDIATSLSLKERLDQHAPVTYLHYLFSFITLDDIVANLDAVRKRITALPRTPRRQLYFIKLFQSAIERDTHGLNAIRSGRLRLMLAESLRAWHPSGMNRRGAYAIHPIAYDPLPESNVDAALYNALWGLQKFLQNPSIAETERLWKEAASSLDTVISAFESTAVRSDTVPHGVDYPTSPNVLNLQLADTHFRRHMLVQYAIFLHHLETTGSLPIGEKDTHAVRQNADFCGKLFGRNGSGEQLKHRVLALLEKDDGNRLKHFVQSLLQREKVWLRWKRTNYSHLETGVAKSPTVFKKRTVLWHQKDKTTGFNNWLQRIKSLETAPENGDIYAALFDRSPVPGVKELKQALQEDLDDAELDEGSKRKNDRKFKWRSLRTLMDEDVAVLRRLSESIELNLDRVLDSTTHPNTVQNPKE